MSIALVSLRSGDDNGESFKLKPILNHDLVRQPHVWRAARLLFANSSAFKADIDPQAFMEFTNNRG
jgi:hypothetical protein